MGRSSRENSRQGRNDKGPTCSVRAVALSEEVEQGVALMGVDIGTTGTKAVVFSEEGQILSTAYQEYPLLHRKPGWVEWEPEAAWRAVEEVVGQASRGSPEPVKGLGFSAPGEAFTPVDERDRPVYNTILALDTRSLEQVRWWEDNFGREEIFRITGQPLSTLYPIPKIQWLKENEPEAFGKARRYLLWEEMALLRLGVGAVTDYSLASRTLAFDIVEKRWSEAILERAGLGEESFAPAVASGTIVGEIPRGVCERLSLARGAVGVTGGFDQCTASLGAGVVASGVASDGTGTVECITPGFEKPVLTRELLAGNHPCCPHTYPGMYVSLAFSLTAGSLLRWYRDLFGGEEIREAQRRGVDAYDVLIEKAKEGRSGVLFLPHLVGSGTPWMDSRSKGAMVGLSLSTTPGDIIRGILESVTLEMKLNLDSMEKAGIRVEELRCTGGGARSAFWLQLKADVWGKRVCSLKATEGGCLACAMLAGVALGVYSSLKEATTQLIRLDRTFEPRPQERQRYQELYEKYSQLYPTLAGLLHQI